MHKEVDTETAIRYYIHKLSKQLNTNRERYIMQTTNNANIIVEKATATRHVINAMFNNNIHMLDGSREASKAFRKMIVVHAEFELGLTEAAAASAYNHARQQACAKELVVREARGVLAQGPAYKPATQAPVAHDKWLIINKETRAVEGSAASKNKAYSAKTDAQTVIKNEDYVA